MKEQKHNNHTQGQEGSRALDHLLDACRFQPVDNTRIKSLVHEKIRKEKLARKRRLRNICVASLSAAACIALVWFAGAGGFTAPSPDLSEASVSELAHAGYNEVIVPTGQRREITLPDGSHLIANAHSRDRKSVV